MNSLSNKLFVAFFAVVVLALGITMIAALQALKTESQADAQRSLIVGENVFASTLRSREAQLSTAVKVLASDFGFKEAVATGENVTLQSALTNHGRRISADLVAFIYPDGAMGISTHDLRDVVAESSDDWRALLDDALSDGVSTRMVMVPGSGAYQIVIAPIRAPQTVGWVTFGFDMDNLLATQLGSLTGLEVSFGWMGRNEKSGVLSSTLPAQKRADLEAKLSALVANDQPSNTIRLNDEDYLSRAMLLDGSARKVIAILQRPMKSAMAAYDRLFEKLILFFAAALAVAAVVARLVAQGVTRPVKLLANAANRIAGGQYSQKVIYTGKDELGVLSDSFNKMQNRISERESKIIHQSMHDHLTQLPNRVALNDRTNVALQKVSRNSSCGSIMLLDIREFSAVNDALGSAIGDQLLCCVARILQERARQSDTIARFSSNGFVILSEHEDHEDATQLAERIRAEFAEPLIVAETSLQVSVTIGMANFPSDGDSVGTLLRRAEIAMRTARRTGKNFARYQKGQDEDNQRQLTILRELKLALETASFDVHYQPQLNIKTRTVRHAEALVRWRHEELGMIFPDEFIPLAEQAGLIGNLTRVVLTKVVRQIKSWRSAGVDLSVSVNISAMDISDPDLVDFVVNLLSQYRVPASQISLEITESAVMANPQVALKNMERLRYQHIDLSIDDFGTGHSSLAQLKSMPATELKIDKSFVLNLPHSEDDATIVRSTIALAHSMNLKVVAEGVEDEACLNFLEKVGCNTAQGFGISRPMPPAAMVDWLVENTTLNLSSTESHEPVWRGQNLVVSPA